jgi:hypothetical protein
MPCYINPFKEDQCVFLTYEGDMTAAEAEAARQEINALLCANRWNRVVVDVTQLQSVPPALELFEFSERLSLDLPRRARVALVIRSDQGRHARLVENILRNKGVILACFPDVENANAWVKSDVFFHGNCSSDVFETDQDLPPSRTYFFGTLPKTKGSQYEERK